MFRYFTHMLVDELISLKNKSLCVWTYRLFIQPDLSPVNRKTDKDQPDFTNIL